MLTHADTSKLAAVTAKANTLKTHLLQLLALVNALPATQRAQLKQWLICLYYAGLWHEITAGGAIAPPIPS